MEIQYFKDYSPALDREVECKVYGYAGKPVLWIPCQDGRFFDFENYHMADVWSPWIESGQVMVFSIDTIDKETWSDTWGNADHRSWVYECWIRYITEEMVPFMQAMTQERNGDEFPRKAIVTGCSLGATHAANLFFRRPDLFDGVMALSGIYSSEYGFGTYMNDIIYNNSPVHYLSNMAPDHPYIEMYNNSKIIICCGTGPWEIPGYTEQIKSVLEAKGIRAWVDFWGDDCSHDWPWWYKQVVYFVPFLLDEN